MSDAPMLQSHAPAVARSLKIRVDQVERTLALAAEGGTVPFIARYRKEATGGLDEVQIQAVLDSAQGLAEMQARRETVLATIEEQGKLTDELRAAIMAAQTKAELEDLYLPYKPKRRTRAVIARERGLEPLADIIWRQEPPDGREPTAIAAGFIDTEKGVPDLAAALAGARDICAERVAEDAALRKAARARALAEGQLTAEKRKEADEKTKFDDYAAHDEPLTSAPSHRILAIMRGEAEKVLRVRLAFPDEAIALQLRAQVVQKPDALFAAELGAAVADGWERLMSLSLEAELRTELKERADREAIEVFAANLRNLLLTAPAGTRAVMALDPGLRTGVKTAALDATGKLLATETLYTERSADERGRAQRQFLALCQRFTPDLVAVGNGTGSREADGFVRDALREAGLSLPIVSVSEQGASIYSASEVARDEFPDLDVSLRGAISIGRRLQDPLAELVKLDPKSIGVGQYQHDVDQGLLKKKLGEVVESCVNAVGVDVNTASPQLLGHVAGVGPSLARKIVAARQDKGAFASRAALRKVSGFGPKTFEQAAGFLRVRGGHPLDDSAVHPERYEVVEQMARDLAVDVKSLVGNAALAQKIEWRKYVAGDLGEPTLKDILAELAKPGRDPRGDFSAVGFREDLRTLEDVKEAMVLPGVVTNVTAFGAFIDVGVHQDGLCHVSQLATRFVKDPSEVVKVGDRVTVKVLAVDLERKRLSLSIRATKEAEPGAQPGAGGGGGRPRDERRGPGGPGGGPRPGGGGGGPRPGGGGGGP
ncbi:MAG TPA: Tex family protein, partial [Polyangia bacterium]